MHGIRVDRLREVRADRSGRRLLRIGRTHEVAVLADRALAFECLDHHRSGDHEIDERFEKRTLAMHCVETFGLRARQLLHLGRNDFQTRFFETGIDLADDVLRDGIGFDDRKGALQRHFLVSL